MPADNGVRLNDRQRIANSREQPIETNEYQSVDGIEGVFLWSSPPQDVYLLPQRPNLCLERCPRPEQVDDRPTNKSAKIPHPTTGLPDSRLTASRIGLRQGHGSHSSDHLTDERRQSEFFTKPCAKANERRSTARPDWNLEVIAEGHCTTDRAAQNIHPTVRTLYDAQIKLDTLRSVFGSSHQCISLMRNDKLLCSATQERRRVYSAPSNSRPLATRIAPVALMMPA
ncbi:MAG TPA: hypothetical protein VII92_07335, partial [Anaerolineae bacterium]